MQLAWNHILQRDDIEETSNIRMATVSETKNEFCRKVSRSSKTYNLPWLNEHRWRLMKQRDLALKAALKSGFTSRDERTFQELRNKVAKADYFIKLINESKGSINY